MTTCPRSNVALLLLLVEVMDAGRPPRLTITCMPTCQGFMQLINQLLLPISSFRVEHIPITKLHTVR